MKLLETIKGWLGLSKPEPEPEPVITKVVSLPNGRDVLVDERGNFVGFAKGDKT